MGPKIVKSRAKISGAALGESTVEMERAAPSERTDRAERAEEVEKLPALTSEPDANERTDIQERAEQLRENQVAGASRSS